MTQRAQYGVIQGLHLKSCMDPYTTSGTSTPRLPFKTPQVLSKGDHQALNRATCGGSRCILNETMLGSLRGGSRTPEQICPGLFSRTCTALATLAWRRATTDPHIDCTDPGSQKRDKYHGVGLEKPATKKQYRFRMWDGIPRCLST